MRQKILVVYHYIAQYREPIFNELNNNQEIKVSFMSDITAKGGIKTVSENFYEKKQFIVLKNIWFKNFLWQKGLLSQILKNEYDIVIFLGDPYFITTWIAASILKYKRRKVFFWTHGFVRDSSIKDKLKLLFYKLCDGLLLYGDKSKENLIKNGVNSKKVFPIYNSLDYELQKRLRIKFQDKRIDKSKFFENTELPQIIFIGRLTKQKKLDTLIHLLYELGKKGMEVNLLFVGDGSEKNNLQNLIKSYGLSKQVYFYGKTYEEEEIAPLIMSSDLCVSPGEVGLTAMHVLAYGTPVITHDSEFHQMPEYEAIIDGYSGRLYSYGSFKSLVDVTYDLLQNPLQNIRENCINVIEKKYTAKKQVDLIIKAINEINK